MVERIEHGDAKRAAKKKSGGKRRMHKLASYESKESWLLKQPHRGKMMKFVVRTADNCTQMLSQTAGLGGTRETWWHYWCSGLQSMLSEKDGFVNTVSHTKFSSPSILPCPSIRISLIT